MLKAAIASTTAKPSMIFARNRKVGSLDEDDWSPARFDNLTSIPPVFWQQAKGSRKAHLATP